MESPFSEHPNKIDIPSMQIMHRNNSLIVACRTGANWYVSRLVEVPGLDINCQDGNGQTAVETRSD